MAPWLGDELVARLVRQALQRRSGLRWSVWKTLAVHVFLFANRERMRLYDMTPEDARALWELLGKPLARPVSRGYEFVDDELGWKELYLRAEGLLAGKSKRAHPRPGR